MNQQEKEIDVWELWCSLMASEITSKVESTTYNLEYLNPIVKAVFATMTKEQNKLFLDFCEIMVQDLRSHIENMITLEARAKDSKIEIQKAEKLRNALRHHIYGKVNPTL